MPVKAIAMDAKLKETLDNVVRLAMQNAEFGSELRKALQIKQSALGVNDVVAADISAIREALEIRANKSISYDFVEEGRLRDQLIVDNLRMAKEEDRLYAFCVNAFYQVETIVNYYFHVYKTSCCSDIKGLLKIIEEYTAFERDEKYRFKRKGTEKDVADIDISFKINALCHILFPDPKDYLIRYQLGMLRTVRNKRVHRSVTQSDVQNEKIDEFLKKNDINKIRIALKKLCAGIKDNVGKQIPTNINQ